MEEIKIALNEHSQIISPQFHDSEISKIIFLDDEVKIYFKLVNGESLCASFAGKLLLLCDGLREGNIISEIVIESGELEDYTFLNKLYWISDGSEDEPERKYLDSMISMIKAKEMKVVRINPSYGCEIIMVCHSISVSRA
jgi:hypothetical protein